MSSKTYTAPCGPEGPRAARHWVPIRREVFRNLRTGYIGHCGATPHESIVVVDGRRMLSHVVTNSPS